MVTSHGCEHWRHFALIVASLELLCIGHSTAVTLPLSLVERSSRGGALRGGSSRTQQTLATAQHVEQTPPNASAQVDAADFGSLTQPLDALKQGMEANAQATGNGGSQGLPPELMDWVRHVAERIVSRDYSGGVPLPGVGASPANGTGAASGATAAVPQGAPAGVPHGATAGAPLASPSVGPGGNASVSAPAPAVAHAVGGATGAVDNVTGAWSPAPGPSPGPARLPQMSTPSPLPATPLVRKVPPPPQCAAPPPPLEHEHVAISLPPFKPQGAKGKAVATKDGGKAWPLEGGGWAFQYPDMAVRMEDGGSTQIVWAEPAYSVEYDESGISYHVGSSVVHHDINGDVMYQQPTGTVHQEGNTLVYHWCNPNVLVYQTPFGIMYYDDGGITYRSASGDHLTHLTAYGEALYQGAGGVSRQGPDGTLTHWTNAGAVFRHADGTFSYTPVGETNPEPLDMSALGPDPFPGPPMTSEQVLEMAMRGSVAGDTSAQSPGAPGVVPAHPATPALAPSPASAPWANLTQGMQPEGAAPVTAPAADATHGAVSAPAPAAAGVTQGAVPAPAPVAANATQGALPAQAPNATQGSAAALR